MEDTLPLCTGEAERDQWQAAQLMNMLPHLRGLPTRSAVANISFTVSMSFG